MDPFKTFLRRKVNQSFSEVSYFFNKKQVHLVFLKRKMVQKVVDRLF